MGLLEMVSLGVALGADSFSVSVGIGMNRIGWRRVIKLSLVFAGMQGLLLTVGSGAADFAHWFIENLASAARNHPKWLDVNPEALFSEIHLLLSVLGACVLAGLGINLIQGYREKGPVCFYRGRIGLLMLAFGVSMDALTAGIGLGMIDASDLSLLAVIVTVTIWVMALFGLSMGRKIGRIIGRKAELVGGLLLLALAVHLLLEVFFS